MSKRHTDYYKLKSLPCYHNKGDLADFFHNLLMNVIKTFLIPLYYLYKLITKQSYNFTTLVTDEGF